MKWAGCDLVYFDHAATSFPESPSVREAVLDAILRAGGNPGRSSHSLSIAAASKVFECRERLADFFGLSDPARVIFTQNTT